MFIGEFGTDAFRSDEVAVCPAGSVDEAMQSSHVLALWNDLLPNMSALDPTQVALGGVVFAFSDEFWKKHPPGSQETCGFAGGGHPDGFSNEEYYGITDIDRIPRQVYHDLQAAFGSALRQKSQLITLTAVSLGFQDGHGRDSGFGEFFKNEVRFYSMNGNSGGRGMNVATFWPNTGQLWDQPRNFDTFRNIGEVQHFLDYIDTIPDEVILLLAVGDELGVNSNNECSYLSVDYVESFLSTLEDLGSQQIRDYCYQDSWSMITSIGSGEALSESLVPGSLATPASSSADFLVGESLSCDVELTLEGRSLTIDLTLGTTEPAFWLVLPVSLFGSQPWVASPVGEVPPREFSFTIENFPSIGNFGVLNAVIGVSGETCIDFDVVSTGGLGPSSKSLRDRALRELRNQLRHR